MNRKDRTPAVVKEEGYGRGRSPDSGVGQWGRDETLHAEVDQVGDSEGPRQWSPGPGPGGVDSVQEVSHGSSGEQPYST